MIFVNVKNTSEFVPQAHSNTLKMKYLPSTAVFDQSWCSQMGHSANALKMYYVADSNEVKLDYLSSTTTISPIPGAHKWVIAEMH